MASYRVFVERVYIAVEYYDVDAANYKDAQKVAIAAAKKLIPDPRACATDNGWLLCNPAETEESLRIPHIGYASGSETTETVQPHVAVFTHKRGTAYKTQSSIEWKKEHPNDC